MRRVLVALLVLTVLPFRVAVASEIDRSDGTGPLDTEADLAPALRLEGLIPEHTFEGMVVPLMYDKWPQLDDTAVPWRMDGEADSGNYTGVYLAAQSWRLAQATAELARLDPGSDAAAFWQAQHDEALDRAREMVGYYHTLVNIASVWQTELEPHVNDNRDPDEVGWIDYGGGLVPGEAGLLMRTCSPDDAAPYADVRNNYSTHHNLIGPLAWDGRQWFCLGATSRDSYAGTLFGLGVALDFLGDEDEAARATVAHDLMAMADYAVKYLWNQPRPHGMIANPALGHNDLEGPVSPLFIQVPLARLHLLQNARHAAHLIGDDAAAARYDLLWEEEVASSVTSGALLDSMVVDAGAPHNAVYKYQLHLMSFFNVIRLEQDPAIREEVMRAMGVLDASLTDDGNAFYETIAFALTGETARLDEAVGLHREWLDYEAFHIEAARRGITPFVHTGRCSITEDPGESAPIEERPLACVPKNQVDMIVTLPTGNEVVTPYQPGTDAALRAKDPLPVGVRRLADFLWQKDPTIIGGDHDTPWRGPSIDFLGTFWMLRYYSEVAPAELHPLPVWTGPRWT
jgi:hypothetical protein